MIYNILGYLFLPFMAIYKLIINTVKNMWDWQKFFFYFFLLCVILQVIEFISYL